MAVEGESFERSESREVRNSSESTQESLLPPAKLADIRAAGRRPLPASGPHGQQVEGRGVSRFGRISRKPQQRRAPPVFRDPKNQKNAKTGSRLLAVFSSSGVARVFWCCGSLPGCCTHASHPCLRGKAHLAHLIAICFPHVPHLLCCLTLLSSKKMKTNLFVDFVFCVFGSLHTGGCRRWCGRRCCGFLKSLLSQEQTLGFLQEQTLGRGNARLVESRANARLLGEQP